MLEQVNTAQVGNYIASGDRQGQVTLHFSLGLQFCGRKMTNFNL